MLLEERLRKFIQQYDKPCKIINQSTKISAEIIKRFQIKPRRVKHNSIGGNMIKGYAASRAAEEKSFALFVASDSPLTSQGFIEDFVETAKSLETEYAIVVPAVFMETQTDDFGRFPLRLINDTGIQLSDSTDAHGRQGFRLSSLLYANPHAFDVNTANTAYNLRKCLNPKVQLKLFQITRNLGYKNVYSKYFIWKDLSITEVENITSEFFGGRLKILPVANFESSYDYDGTDDEYRRLNDLLRNI